MALAITRSPKWSHHWGERPLPAGVIAIGIVGIVDEGKEGALLQFDTGAYALGRDGSITDLDTQEVVQALARVLTLYPTAYLHSA